MEVHNENPKTLDLEYSECRLAFFNNERRTRIHFASDTARSLHTVAVHNHRGSRDLHPSLLGQSELPEREAHF